MTSCANRLVQGNLITQISLKTNGLISTNKHYLNNNSVDSQVVHEARAFLTRGKLANSADLSIQAPLRSYPYRISNQVPPSYTAWIATPCSDRPRMATRAGGTFAEGDEEIAC